MQSAFFSLLWCLFASASALSEANQEDGSKPNGGLLTPTLHATQVQECFKPAVHLSPLGEAACQKTFRGMFAARTLDIYNFWGPHFHWARWQATSSDCAVYLETRDYYKGKDIFRIRDVVNAAISITRECSREGLGGRASIGNHRYFYVEVRTAILSSPLDPPLSSNGSLGNSSVQDQIKASNFSNILASSPTRFRDVQCKDSGSSPLTDRACATSARLIGLEDDVHTYKSWGPRFSPKVWQAYDSPCAITLSARDPIHGTDSFTLSAVEYISRYVVRTCAQRGLRFGGAINVGTQDRFIVSVDASPPQAPIGVATTGASSLIEPQTSSTAGEGLPSKLLMRRKHTTIPGYLGLSAEYPMGQRSLLNKTMFVECGRRSDVPPVNTGTCSVALRALEVDVQLWGSDSQPWRAIGVHKTKMRWDDAPSRVNPCYIVLRSGYDVVSRDRFSYTNILQRVQEILEVCASRGGRATVGDKRMFQVSISRDPQLITPNDDSPATSISMALESTSSTTSLLSVPTVVEDEIGLMKAASMLTLNSNQLALSSLCDPANATGEAGPRLDSSSCAGSLALLTSASSNSGLLKFGPHFTTRAWHENGSRCAIFLISSDDTSESSFSMRDVANSANEVLSNCGGDGQGGVARVGATSSGFFVGITTGPADSSGPLGSTNLTVPILAAGISILSSSATVSTQSSGPIASEMSLPILPNGGLNVISTATVIIPESSSATSLAPVQTAVGDNTS